MALTLLFQNRIGNYSAVLPSFCHRNGDAGGVVFTKNYSAIFCRSVGVMGRGRRAGGGGKGESKAFHEQPSAQTKSESASAAGVNMNTTQQKLQQAASRAPPCRKLRLKETFVTPMGKIAPWPALASDNTGRPRSGSTCVLWSRCRRCFAPS